MASGPQNEQKRCYLLLQSCCCSDGNQPNRLQCKTKWFAWNLNTKSQCVSFDEIKNRQGLPPFSSIRDFRKQNTRGNISKVSVNHTCYRQIESKSTNHMTSAWRKKGLKVTLVSVIGGLRSDLPISRKTDWNFRNVSAGVLFFKVAYQRKRW